MYDRLMLYNATIIARNPTFDPRLFIARELKMNWKMLRERDGFLLLERTAKE